MADEYFYLHRPQHKWGDYGHALVHGYGGVDEDANVCRLRRTGPFVPPVTLPSWAVVVTAAVRGQLERSGLTGYSFVHVDLRKVVALDWHEWDHDSPEPGEYPDGGEPEQYIDAGEHSPAAAAAVGELWALSIPEIARVERDRSVVASRRELHLVLSTTPGFDFVRSPDVGYNFVSRRAMEWLRSRYGKWLEFEAASVR